MTYDQWKTASPYDDEEEGIDITVNLESLGRRGHGLCGKNTDLDPGGQILVCGAVVLPDRNIPIISIKVRVYANICCPEEPELSDIAESCVMDQTQYNGEWTGSDYWTFSLQDQEPYVIEANLSSVDVPDDADDIDKNKIAQVAYNAIFSDDEIKSFRKAMTNLSKTIYGITL